MNITEQQINKICELIDVDPQNILWKYHEKIKNPSFSPNDKSIRINKMNNWQEIYQFSHEALHLSFFEHTNGMAPRDAMWIEEILCEAFSLYCVELLCKDEIIDWYGYYKRDFYIWNCKISGPKPIASIEQLNEELDKDKDYEILQYIHPTVLKIWYEIRIKPERLREILNYLPYIKGNKIIRNNNISITTFLFDLQQQIERN